MTALCLAPRIYIASYLQSALFHSFFFFFFCKSKSVPISTARRAHVQTLTPSCPKSEDRMEMIIYFWRYYLSSPTVHLLPADTTVTLLFSQLLNWHTYTHIPPIWCHDNKPKAVFWIFSWATFWPSLSETSQKLSKENRQDDVLWHQPRWLE